jgi:hypothetical protein
VMTVDYMSSEDSDHDPEPPNRVTRYIVRPLCWQSNELKRVKKRLDKKHMQRKRPWADKKEDVAKEYWGSFSKEKARELHGMGVHVHTVVARL